VSPEKEEEVTYKRKRHKSSGDCLPDDIAAINAKCMNGSGDGPKLNGDCMKENQISEDDEKRICPCSLPAGDCSTENVVVATEEITVNGEIPCESDIVNESSPLELDMLKSCEQNLHCDTVDLTDSCPVNQVQDLETSPSDVFQDTGSTSTSTDTACEDKADNKLLLSPTHSVRTPVTENDPLGLFTASLSPISNQYSAPAACTVPDLLMDLQSNTDRGTAQPPAQSNVARGNLLLDLEPFSNSSTPTRVSETSDTSLTPTRASVNAGTPKVVQSVMEKSASMSSDTTSSPGSPSEAWAPLSQSQPDPRRTDSPQTPPVMERSRSIHGETPSRRTRLAARSESITNAVRSGFGLFATKFNEFKQSMATPPKSSNYSSSSSLNRSVDADKYLDIEDDTSLRKAGSLDLLETQSDNRGDTASIGTDSTDSKPRSRPSSRYASFGRSCNYSHHFTKFSSYYKFICSDLGMFFTLVVK
jgi:hypothetical protein